MSGSIPALDEPLLSTALEHHLVYHLADALELLDRENEEREKPFGLQPNGMLPDPVVKFTLRPLPDLWSQL